MIIILLILCFAKVNGECITIDVPESKEIAYNYYIDIRLTNYLNPNESLIYVNLDTSHKENGQYLIGEGCEDISFRYLNMSTGSNDLSIPYNLSSGCRSENTSFYLKANDFIMNGTTIRMYFSSQYWCNDQNRIAMNLNHSQEDEVISQFDYVLDLNYTRNKWECYEDITMNLECSDIGECIGLDFCLCNVTGSPPYSPGTGYGNQCQETIGEGSYDGNEIKINYVVRVKDLKQFYDEKYPRNDDSAPDLVDLCENFIVNYNQLFKNISKETCKLESLVLGQTTNFIIKKDDLKEKIESIQIRSVSMSDQYIQVPISLENENNSSLLIIIAIVVVAGIVFLIVVGLIVFIPLYCIISKERGRLNKFGKLKDVDLLIKEKESELDHDIAHLNINKKLFEIEYDQLEIQEKIGEGGGGSRIFLAKWTGKNVAFKCFKTNDICQSQNKFDQFEREISILSSINHPFILQFLGAVLQPPRVGIVIEYCANGDLKSFLKKQNEESGENFNLDEKLKFIRQISSGVTYLHERNVIHRDLKCENVLVDDQLEMKIMDFGLSKVVESISQTKTRRLGTSVYMAPEVVRGDAYDEKCDVFSFGIMIYEIISEREPYEESSETYNLEFKVSQSENFRPKIFPLDFIDVKGIVPIMTACWSHESKDRPTFEEINERLKENLKDSKKEQTIAENKINDMNNEEADLGEMKKKLNLLKQKNSDYKEELNQLKEKLEQKNE